MKKLTAKQLLREVRQIMKQAVHLESIQQFPANLQKLKVDETTSLPISIKDLDFLATTGHGAAKEYCWTLRALANPFDKSRIILDGYFRVGEGDRGPYAELKIEKITIKLKIGWTLILDLTESYPEIRGFSSYGKVRPLGMPSRKNLGYIKREFAKAIIKFEDFVSYIETLPEIIPEFDRYSIGTRFRIKSELSKEELEDIVAPKLIGWLNKNQPINFSGSYVEEVFENDYVFQAISTQKLE